jgi:alginate O-acetyltransferase complex protein AlgI
MNIVSLGWVLWMALTAAGYWTVPRGWQDLWLMVATGAFLLLYSPTSALILGALTVLVFQTTHRDRVGGPVVLLWVTVVVALLASTRAAFLPTVAAADPGTDLVAIAPLGLSFYCLRLLHYVFERQKNRLAPHGFRQFAGYMFFLPTIVVGPVHRFPAYLRDLWRLRWDHGKFATGLERILYGYVKVTFLSSFLLSTLAAKLIAPLAAQHPAVAAYLGVLKTGVNLYVLFSGYSDVAIGFALLLGHEIIENFNWPLLSRNIAEFWAAWHISVSSWCRNYVYRTVIALTRRPALAAVAAMLVLALWHELSSRYLVWALYNGAGIAAWQWFQRAKRRLPWRLGPAFQAVARTSSVVLTFHFVILGFVMIEQRSWHDVWLVYAQLLGETP